MKKGQVSIAEMSIKVTVIAFALKAFKEDDIEEIKAFISANPFFDDLAMSYGQITVDTMQNIIYTGSALAANYIAMAYSRKSINRKYSITVYKKTIPEDSVPMIMAMIATGESKPKKKRSQKRIPHNLQPVLDEIKREKTEIKKRKGEKSS